MQELLCNAGRLDDEELEKLKTMQRWALRYDGFRDLQKQVEIRGWHTF